jgi:hypothetical protein
MSCQPQTPTPDQLGARAEQAGDASVAVTQLGGTPTGSAMGEALIQIITARARLVQGISAWNRNLSLPRDARTIARGIRASPESSPRSERWCTFTAARTMALAATSVPRAAT